MSVNLYPFISSVRWSQYRHSWPITLILPMWLAQWAWPGMAKEWAKTSFRQFTLYCFVFLCDHIVHVNHRIIEKQDWRRHHYFQVFQNSGCFSSADVLIIYTFLSFLCGDLPVSAHGLFFAFCSSSLDISSILFFGDWIRAQIIWNW